MKQLISKREGYSNLARKEARNHFIIQKRRRHKVSNMHSDLLLQITQQNIIQFQNRLLDQQSNITQLDKQQLIQRLGSAIMKNHIHIHKETLLFLLKLIQKNNFITEITNLLVNLTALQNLNIQLLQIIREKKGILLNLIERQDIHLIQNIVIIMGNMSGEDNEIKEEIINSNFFYDLYKIVEINKSHLQLLGITIWAFKNVLLKNKKNNNHNINVPQQFLHFIARFIAYIFQDVQKIINNKNQKNKQQFKTVQISAIQLLKIVFSIPHQIQHKKNIYQTIIKKALPSLNHKFMFLIQNIESNSLLLIQLIDLFAILSNQYPTVLITIEPTLRNFIEQKINHLNPKSSNLVQSLLQIIKHSQKNVLLAGYLKNIQFYEQFINNQTNNHISVLISELYFLMSMHIKNIQNPRSEVDFFLNKKMDIVLKNIKTLLESKNNEIIYNSIRTLWNIIEIKEDSLLFLKVLQKVGIIQTIINLELNENKQIYEEVQKILEQFKVKH